MKQWHYLVALVAIAAIAIGIRYVTTPKDVVVSPVQSIQEIKVEETKKPEVKKEEAKPVQATPYTAPKQPAPKVYAAPKVPELKKVCVENTAQIEVIELAYQLDLSAENERHDDEITRLNEYYNNLGLFNSGQHMAAIQAENQYHQQQVAYIEADYLAALAAVQPICKYE